MTLDVARNSQPVVPSHGRELRATVLSGSVARVGADSRLTRELRSIAVDLLGPYESDELPTECAAWVDATIEAAVSVVAHSSLAALVRALEALLAVAPPDVARQLDEMRLRHDAGLV